MKPRVAAAVAELDAWRVERATRQPTLLEMSSWETPTSPTRSWMEHAFDIVRRLAEHRLEFTVADVVPLLDATYDLRCVGVVMRRAALERD